MAADSPNLQKNNLLKAQDGIFHQFSPEPNREFAILSP
jgi:hypothetical protein